MEQGQRPQYVLGHTQPELGRLAAQARLVDPVTERFLRQAGVSSGMRVLDVGTGAGHVAFVAAGLVGDGGAVVGIDRSEVALATAADEAAVRGLSNVTFVTGDPAEISFDRPFDAVVGRYVLQFLPDPAAALRRLASFVRPGGLVVFHELDWGGVWSFPPTSTYDDCCAWCVQAVERSGAETRMGMKLHATFVAAGLPGTSLRLEASMGGAAQDAVPVTQLVQLVRTLAPTIERLGIATAEEIGLDTLAERIVREAESLDSVLVGRVQVGCWATV